MKRVIIIIIIVVLLISSISCAKQIAEENNTITIAPVPKENDSIETTGYSSAPESTPQKDQDMMLKEYNGLLENCREYTDWSAAVLIRDMYNDEKISEEHYTELASVSGFLGTQDLNDGLWVQVKKHIERISNILNGQQKDLDKAGLDRFYQELCIDSQQDIVYINALDSQEKKDRVLKSIRYINEWIDEQTEENFDNVKIVFFSDELTPGEVIILSCYMYYAKGQDKKRIEFLDNQGFKDYTDDALFNLFNENNSN